MSKQPPPAPTASAVGPCPTVIQIVGRPALEVYPAPSHHPTTPPVILSKLILAPLKTHMHIFIMSTKGMQGFKKMH